MKINELLYEAADNPFDAIKAMNVEFKAMAADMELSLVAGMGWPNINQKGGWFGGGLGSKGGKSKKNVDNLTLPVEIRRKAFLKALAQKLEGYMEEGREVEIGQGSSRSNHSEKGIRGHVFDQLMKNMIVADPPGNVQREKMPCVVWFVGLSGDMASKSPLRITGNFYGEPPAGQQWGGEHLYVDVGASIDLDAGKKLNMALNRFKKANAESTSWDNVKHTSTTKSATPKWFAFIRDVGTALSKILGKPLPDTFDGTHRGYFDIDRKVLPSSTQRLTPEQIELVIATMWKHFK